MNSPLRSSTDNADQVLKRVYGVRQRLAATTRSALMDLERLTPPAGRRKQWEQETYLLQQVLKFMLTEAVPLPAASQAEKELRVLEQELELHK